MHLDALGTQLLISSIATVVTLFAGVSIWLMGRILRRPVASALGNSWLFAAAAGMVGAGGAIVRELAPSPGQLTAWTVIELPAMFVLCALTVLEISRAMDALGGRGDDPRRNRRAMLVLLGSLCTGVVMIPANLDLQGPSPANRVIFMLSALAALVVLERERRRQRGQPTVRALWLLMVGPAVLATRPLQLMALGTAPWEYPATDDANQLVAIVESILAFFVLGLSQLLAVFDLERSALHAARETLRVREQQAARRRREELLTHLMKGVAQDFHHLARVISLVASRLTARPCAHPQVAWVAETLSEAARRAASMAQRADAYLDPTLHRTGVLELTTWLRTLTPRLQQHVTGRLLQVQMAEQALYAQADADDLERVLLNLLNNARDASPADSVITIRLDGTLQESDGERYLTLTVDDDGVGVPAADLERIFEPYFTTKRGTGTGLGLPTSRALLRRAGGDLRAASTPGRGTSMRVRLKVLS